MCSISLSLSLFLIHHYTNTAHVCVYIYIYIYAYICIVLLLPHLVNATLGSPPHERLRIPGRDIRRLPFVEWRRAPLKFIHSFFQRRFWPVSERGFSSTRSGIEGQILTPGIGTHNTCHGSCQGYLLIGACARQCMFGTIRINVVSKCRHDRLSCRRKQYRFCVVAPVISARCARPRTIENRL